MTPDYRAALYTLIENAIETAAADDALFDAVTPRTSRGRVEPAGKTVKVVTGPGRFNFGGETDNRAMECLFTIQAWVIPASDDEYDLEEALDEAMLMAEELHTKVYNNQTLSGAVCLIDAHDYDAEFASHGGMTKAAAYLDGVINPIGESG